MPMPTEIIAARRACDSAEDAYVRAVRDCARALDKGDDAAYARADARRVSAAARRTETTRAYWALCDAR